MQLLKARCPEEAAPLLEYFDQTYVSGTYVQRRRNQHPGIPAVKLRLIPTRFPPELWNIHKATMKDCPRTNNLCEGWNNKFYHLVGYQHPSIWKLIWVLQQEEAAVSAVIARDSVNRPGRKQRRYMLIYNKDWRIYAKTTQEKSWPSVMWTWSQHQILSISF